MDNHRKKCTIYSEQALSVRYTSVHIFVAQLYETIAMADGVSQESNVSGNGQFILNLGHGWLMFV